MKESLHPVWLIAKRELRDQLRDWRILAPLAFLTLGFPFLMNAFAYATVEFVNQYGGTLLVDRLVPFSILIIGFFPLTVSLLGALESFVGEKERGTIEPLLGTPLLDWQLYLGKLIVGVFTPILSSFISIAIYLAMVSRQELNMPETTVFVQLFLLNISHALLMVGAAMLFSIQSTSVKAANLLASFIIVPVAMLMLGESSLLFWANNEVLWLAILAVTIMAGLLVRLGLAHFQREYLLGREIDVLNLRWMGRTFWGYFIGEAESIFDWYCCSVGATLQKLKKPILVLVLLAVMTILGGYLWASNNLHEYVKEVDPEQLAELQSSLLRTGELARVSEVISVPHIFWNNLRATLVIGFFGLFSFSVLGVILYLLNIGLIGLLLGLFSLLGYAPLPLVAAGILPHGIFEIPALLLSCAAVMNTGLVLVTPQAGKTIGEVVLESLADWLRIILGLAIPLLALAAVIETYITPYLLMQIIGAIR